MGRYLLDQICRMSGMLRFCLIILLLFLPDFVVAQSNGVRIQIDGRTVSGQGLAFNGNQLALLRRDGHLQLIETSKNQLTRLDSSPRPFTLEELKSAFFKEYGQRYDVSTTDNFLVVHPWGSPKTWAQPFETFHSRFVSYFKSKGFKLTEPEYPLIAMVLRSRNDFDRSLINEVQRHDSRIAGYYSRITNRITTFDPAGQLRESDDTWMYSSWAIIHEATHQSAFNTGVHNRFAPPPTWLSEGIATMFEAKGVNDHKRFKKPVDRVNKRMLKQLRSHLNSPEFYNGMINLIANDKLFYTHLDMAYGISWGLAFYLSETQPDQFFAFVANDAKRKNFASYSSEQRLRDFGKAFGNDFKGLAEKLRQYYRK